MVVATPAALELSRSHSTIRSFLEDGNISIDILQDLWDLMMQCPPRIVWDAISDYRTFINTAFEEHRDVPKNEKIFLLGGYIHLPEFLNVPSKSPEISWYYLYYLTPICCVAQLWSYSRSFREAMVLCQTLNTAAPDAWAVLWDHVEDADGCSRRSLRAACSFHDILVRLDHNPVYSEVQYGSNVWTEHQARSLVFFQLSLDDPYALPLIEEIQKSPRRHRIWARNANSKEVVCSPRNPQEWTNRARFARRKGDLEEAQFFTLHTLAESLSWAEERAVNSSGGRHLFIKSSPYSDHYDVLVVGVRASYAVQDLLLDIVRKATLVRHLAPKDPMLNIDRKKAELFASHPFVSICNQEDESADIRATSYEDEEEGMEGGGTLLLARPTRFPQTLVNDHVAYFQRYMEMPSEAKDHIAINNANWGLRNARDATALIHRLEAQGILELDTSWPVGLMDIDVPVGCAIKILDHPGLYIDVKDFMMFEINQTFIRPWDSGLPQDGYLLHSAAVYHREFPSASFTLFQLCSGAIHWPFKYPITLPYFFSSAEDDTKIYTSRYLLKDPPGSETALHGYMSFTFSKIRDSIVWRDMLLCMKPDPQEFISLMVGIPERKQGDIDLAQDLVRIGTMTDKIYYEGSHITSAKKWESELKFEMHGPLNLKDLEEVVDKCMTREWQ